MSHMNNQEATKVCSHCQVPKPLSEFYKHKTTKDGLSSWCNKCESQNSKQYYFKNQDAIKEKVKQWSKNNPEKVKNCRAKWLLIHANDKKLSDHLYYVAKQDKIKARSKQKRIENPEYNRHYRSNRKEETKQYNKHYKKQRVENDICFRIRCNYSARIRVALQRNFNPAKKSAKTIDLLMCTILEARTHVESLWLPGMTWVNWGYGPGKWNLDHIIPCSFFSLLDPVEQYMCFRWQNLQPLWWEDNMKKSDDIINS